MIDKISYTSDRTNPGIAFTVCIAGLIFSSQAQSTDFSVINAPLAPNPNQAGDVIQIFGQANNTEDYNNAGAIRLIDGASLIHGSNILFNGDPSTSPVFNNAQGGVVSSSGKQVTFLPDGSSIYRNSQIYNLSTFNNTDVGSTVNNQNGAIFDNGGSLSLFGTGYSNAVFNNRQGATINNSGAYEATQFVFNHLQSSSINNYGTFSNSDQGSVINNQNGAALNNGGNLGGLLGGSVSTANMINHNGAEINNTGVFIPPNQGGNATYLRSSINNNALLTNSGENSRLSTLNGAVLNNGTQNWFGFPSSSTSQLTNENGAQLSNSGAFNYIGFGGYPNVLKSTLNNYQATVLNTGNGSQLLNEHGAIVNNGDGYQFSSSSQLLNQDGALLTNTGVYQWTDETGVNRIEQSSINNNIGGNITNSGIGSKLKNQQGAALNNGQDFGGFNSLGTVLTNQNGATLTNSGAHHWQDQNGQHQVTASLINNQGSLINTGAGTTLNNLDGGKLVNGMFGSLENKDNAVLVNGTGASLQSDGRIINDALITNAGSFQMGFGTLEGNGQYLQTAGETMLSGGFLPMPQWTQSLTTIQGGTLTATGAMNGNLVIDGGTVALGTPNNFNNGFAMPHPGLSINGDLTFNSGLLKINVGSESLSPVGLFGNPFFSSTTVTDALKIFGSTTFNGGVVDIDFVNGFTPTLGESLAWLTFTGDLNGLDKLQYRFTGLAKEHALAFNREGNNLTWTVTAAAVPLPASSWLFITGVLSLMARRRQATIKI